MRVLVTGAAGFIGAHVVRELVVRGHEPLAIVRTVPALPGPPIRPADLLEADLGDQERVRRWLRLVRPDAVIHLAWYAHPSDYLESRRNLDSLTQTLGLAETLGVLGCPRLVGIGTCLEYAPSVMPLGEEAAVDPRTLYAATKLAAYHAARALLRGTATSFAWARLFHLHGPGEPNARVVPSVAVALRTAEPIELTPCSQIRDVLRVEDVAAALVSIAEQRHEGPINVASGQGIALRAFLERLAAQWSRAELLRFGVHPSRRGEPQHVVADVRRLAALGFTPRHPPCSFDYLVPA